MERPLSPHSTPSVPSVLTPRAALLGRFPAVWSQILNAEVERLKLLINPRLLYSTLQEAVVDPAPARSTGEITAGPTNVTETRLGVNRVS